MIFEKHKKFNMRLNNEWEQKLIDTSLRETTYFVYTNVCLHCVFNTMRRTESGLI